MQWPEQSWVSHFAHVLLHKLQWLSVGFRVQFEILAVTYIVLYGIGAHFLRDQLSIIVSAYWVHSGRIAMPQIPSIKHCHFGGLKKCVFSVSALWNSTPKRSMVLTFLGLQALETKSGVSASVELIRFLLVWLLLVWAATFCFVLLTF